MMANLQGKSGRKFGGYDLYLPNTNLPHILEIGGRDPESICQAHAHYSWMPSHEVHHMRWKKRGMREGLGPWGQQTIPQQHAKPRERAIPCGAPVPPSAVTFFPDIARPLISPALVRTTALTQHLPG